MNKHFTFRIALMIALLCGVSARGWADGETVVLNESTFSSFPDNSIATIRTCNGWTYVYAGYMSSLEAILINGSPGYVETPELVLNGTATLSFDYRSAAAPTNYSFTITVTGGEFDGFSGELTNPKTTFQTKVITIKNVAEKTKIKFNQSGTNGLFIKNVRVTTPSTPVDITLSETTSNATTLSDNANKLANVTIGRTFPANTWCTLCLPFDVTTASVKAACGQTDNPQMQVFDKVEGSRMEFVATGAVTAGTPFLLKLAAEVTTNPTFSGVTVSSTTAQSVGSGSYSFIGTYSPVTIPSTGWFLKADGKLYQPSGSNSLKGLRAYFTFPPSPARPVVSIANDDGSTTDIAPTAINVGPSAEAVYSMDGRQVASPKSGSIYIIRQADGTIRKITIR